MNKNAFGLSLQEQKKLAQIIENTLLYPSNNIDFVGFPEAHILPHCNGNTELCGQLSAIYHLGQNFPITGNPILDSICWRLTRVSGYGLFAYLDK